MDNKNLGHHISRQFNQEIDGIRNKVLAMGGLVADQIDLAAKSFIQSDLEMAEKVIQQDELVNNLEMNIDQECTEILAKRQPAAFDLRMLIATIKAITDLERIGDEAARISKMTIRLENTEYYHDQFHEIQHLLDMVKSMLNGALDSFARLDVHDLAQITGKDLKVDREYASIVRQLITKMMEDPRNITRTLDILWVARALERIGDHSCNICEHVIYMVQGEDVRHLSQDELEKVLQQN